MPRFLPRIALVLACAITAPWGLEAQTNVPAATTTATPGPTAPALTVKERLSAKWKDEQRVDNCNVPPEKRGSKPRPDACANAQAK